MMGNGLTIGATCAACHQPRGWAISAAMTWCELCGACFRCGVRDVAMSVTAHECGKAPVILATGPTHPGYVHSTNLRVEGREAPRRCESHDEFCLACGIADPATVEACARAGYMTRFDQQLFPWDGASPACRDAWRAVARAVLAAAGVTR